MMPNRCREVDLGPVQHLDQATSIGNALDVDDVHHSTRRPVPFCHHQAIASAKLGNTHSRIISRYMPLRMFWLSPPGENSHVGQVDLVVRSCGMRN